MLLCHEVRRARSKWRKVRTSLRFLLGAAAKRGQQEERRWAMCMW
jgi:hypothetical protein